MVSDSQCKNGEKMSIFFCTSILDQTLNENWQYQSLRCFASDCALKAKEKMAGISNIERA